MWTESLEKTQMLGKIEGRRRRDNRGWDGWIASLIQRTWVWANSGSWWWTGMPGCCSSWGRKKSDMTERLNWRTFFQINWFDLLAVQGTLKSLLQFKSISSLVLSLPYDSIPHPYMSTGKTMILTIYGPLLAKWCLCFLIHYLGLS